GAPRKVPPYTWRVPASPGSTFANPRRSEVAARWPGPGRRPDQRRLRLVREQGPVGDPRHLPGRPAVRLLPGPRGPGRARGLPQDEGDRPVDPNRREGVPESPVPNRRRLHGDL